MTPSSIEHRAYTSDDYWDPGCDICNHYSTTNLSMSAIAQFIDTRTDHGDAKDRDNHYYVYKHLGSI